MDAPYQASPDVHVLPTSLPLPGVGVLTVNAYVLRAEEPVLVDAGIGFDGDDFVDALTSIVDPAALRWIWLTHDDADHTGSLERVLALAPRAKLVTHALGALRMATWWRVPLDRVHAIRPGDRLPVGDRTLLAVPAPLFDNPTTVGLVDTSTGTLFSVDSFGGLLPEPAQDAGDVPPDALAGGMVAWATFDSPWTQFVDRRRYDAVLDGVRRLEPTRILSSHLPAADGQFLEQFLGVLAGLPDAAPFVAPDREGFEAMARAIMAGAPVPA
ncbi:MAG: MBL fold metallo-hydrolase [Actinomycetota bacterium]|nr:MBL fold metallo-hydrolase [Actinomycetota bacterium]